LTTLGFELCYAFEEQDINVPNRSNKRVALSKLTTMEARNT